MTAPPTWLIDTNVVSEMMRMRPEHRVAAFLDSIADEGLGLASVTVWEVLDGIGRLDHDQLRRDPANRFRDLLDVLFDDRIVEWSLADAQACARIMENKRRHGEALDDHVPDAFLAAVAATRGLAVVTRNAGEFSKPESRPSTHGRQHFGEEQVFRTGRKRMPPGSSTARVRMIEA